MAEFKIAQAQKELVEKLGVFYEKSGMQPAACRVMALLIVSDQTELTFEEIQQALASGMNDTLSKPFEPEKLHRKIAALLGEE